MADEIDKTEQTEQDPQEHFAQKMEEIFSAKDESLSESNGQADQYKTDDTIVSDESAEADSTVQDDVQTEDANDGTIDPEVLEIFNDYGLSQETIDKIAQESPDLLTSIKEEIENEKKPIQKQETEKRSVSKNTFKEIKVNLDPDIVGADVKSAIDNIVSRINEQGKSLESETQKLQQERESAFQQKIDGHFDRYAKQVPNIGNSLTLTESQYKERIKLFRHAMVTSEIDGIPIERAIEVEVNKFKNQDGEKVAQQKLIDKLNGQKKHFTNPPTRRHSDLASRKFASEEERKEAVMSDAYKQAGIED
jgi:hypothetical protein